MIPGSMGTAAFLASGNGNPVSLQAASHGSGRVLSRRQAKRELRGRDLKAELRARGIELLGGDLDEHPEVYKPIEEIMSNELLPEMTRELAPDVMDAWRTFNQAVLRDGALPSVTKELIAVAVAHTTQCAYCIQSHTKAALRKGASEEQLMEAIWVAAEMRAGPRADPCHAQYPRVRARTGIGHGRLGSGLMSICPMGCAHAGHRQIRWGPRVPPPRMAASSSVK